MTISPLDAYFAAFLARLENRRDAALELAAALASHCTRMGHVCVDLNEVDDRLVVEGLLGRETETCPSLEEWQLRLKAASVVGEQGSYRPLVIDEQARVYLYRYWKYQDRLADWISQSSRAASRLEDLSESQGEVLQERLSRLFSENRGKEKDEIDWPAVAALAAIRKGFSIISGGPGTGKTTVVCKILAVLVEYSGNLDLQIALAAPTGKAAARLQEAVKRSKEDLDGSSRVKTVIPEAATTIHRLLGVVPGSSDFYYNDKNPLPADVVVVDEASMVDLALLSKLVQAIGPASTLILLGDKNQLASVEAGAVLADICDASGLYTFGSDFCKDLKRYTGYDLPASNRSAEGGVLQDAIVELQKSHRFGPHSGIQAVSHLVNNGKGVAAVNALKGGRYADVRWMDLPLKGDLPAALDRWAMGAFERYLEAQDVEEAFARFDEFRILCALREGPYGVKGLNQNIEDRLRSRGLIPTNERWYKGRPVLITRNDYTTGVFNGDVGITWPQDGRLVVFFRTGSGGIQRFHPARLPEHETVYAMTVHKSQGSEFDDLLFVLPDKAYPVITRELIYTGFTRARRHVQIWTKEDVFLSGVSTQTRRMSGMRDRIWDRSARRGPSQSEEAPRNGDCS